IGPSAGFDGNSQIQLSLSSETDNYSGVYSQNTSTGAFASTDFIVGADNDGVALIGHFGDFGVQGSGFDPLQNPSFGGVLPNDVYLYGSGGNLILGTDAGVAGKVIKFFVGGLTTDDNIATLTATGFEIHTGTGASGLQTDLICSDGTTSKLYTSVSGDIVCGTDQTGGGSGNVVDTLADTLAAGNTAAGINIVNV